MLHCPRCGKPGSGYEGCAVCPEEGVFVNLAPPLTDLTGYDLGRAVLMGVLFESNAERLRMVATDSYRLALRNLPAIGLSVTGVLPARGLRELPNTVGASKVDVSFTDRQGVFGSAAGVLRLRMIEGNFPKYED